MYICITNNRLERQILKLPLSKRYASENYCKECFEAFYGATELNNSITGKSINVTVVKVNLKVTLRCIIFIVKEANAY